MSTSALLLVLLSCLCHAWWNYLLKRANGGSLFVGLSKVAEVAIFAPVFIVVGARGAAESASALWPLIIVGAALTLLNYAMLGLAYGRGELSLVYPIARGSILLFLPIAGYFLAGEQVDAAGVVAFALIVLGILVLQLPSLNFASARGFGRRLLSSQATVFALLAGLAAAGYSLWDKRAVQRFEPFTYFYSYTVLVAIAYAAFMAKRFALEEIRLEWRSNRWAIVQVGFLNTLAYLLVLHAFRSGVQSSYVVALRQLSVVVGAFLSWRLLHEPMGPPKRLGITLLVTGSVLVALAR